MSKPSSKKKPDVVHVSGKRKRAIARATLKPGSGRVTVNNCLLDHYGTTLTRSRILEPIKLAGGPAQKFDIAVTVRGGGVTGQADAARLAIARAFASTDQGLRQVYLEYDRQLLVADVRRKESAKPNHHGQARSTVQKSYR
jgi:small subunit ribosomal protein S9